MKFSITEQEKGDCLIEVTTWTGLTEDVCGIFVSFSDPPISKGFKMVGLVWFFLHLSQNFIELGY
jgi:hypothetical protein